MLEKNKKQEKRHKRIRAKIQGTVKRPRLCVFRSSNHIYAQLIDDDNGKILASSSDLELKKNGHTVAKKKKENAKTAQGRKTLLAFEVGKSIAQKALEKKIDKIVFDRKGYKYHGRVRAVAEGAREAGLKF